MSASIIVDRLDVFINYEDESPRRVAELIIDICERHSERSSVEIAPHLDAATFDQGVVLEVGSVAFDGIATGRAKYTLNSRIGIVDHDLRRFLANIASERCSDCDSVFHSKNS